MTHKSDFENFIRGSDTLWHRLQMFGAGLSRLLAVGGIVGLLTAYLLFSLPTSAIQREIIFKRAAAQVLGVSVYLPTGDGKKQLVSAKTAIQVTESAAPWMLWILVCLGVGGFVGFAVVKRVSRYQIGKGEDAIKDKFLRGQTVVSEAELSSLTKDASKLGFQIGEVNVPDSLLMRNIAFVGSMGTGKSQGIFNFLDAANQSGVKAVVYDLTGEFVERYYSPERGDVILNPYDKRGRAWSVFADLRGEIDFSALSVFFVPEQKGENNPFFTNAARILFEDLLRLVKLEPAFKKTMGEVSRIAATLPNQEISDLLEKHGLPSAVTVRPDSEASRGVCMSLMAQPSIRFFNAFEGEGFSIRDFIKSDEQRGWLFITSHAELHEAIKPFAGVWIETALMAVMSGRPTHDVRVLFVLDELGSLPRLKALETGLTLSRKYGAAWILGFQNTAQLDLIYGEPLRLTLLSNTQTKVIFRTEEEKSAKSLSAVLGEKEVDEASAGESYGIESTKDSSTINRKRTEIKVVLPAEIQVLPDLTAYLKLAGNFPVARVRIPIKDRPIKAPAYELKELGFVGQGVGMAEPEKQQEGPISAPDASKQNVNWWEADK
jgi:hypothetical protein